MPLPPTPPTSPDAAAHVAYSVRGLLTRLSASADPRVQSAAARLLLLLEHALPQDATLLLAWTTATLGDLPARGHADAPGATPTPGKMPVHEPLHNPENRDKQGPMHNAVNRPAPGQMHNPCKIDMPSPGALPMPLHVPMPLPVNRDTPGQHPLPAQALPLEPACPPRRASPRALPAHAAPPIADALPAHGDAPPPQSRPSGEAPQEPLPPQGR